MRVLLATAACALLGLGSVGCRHFSVDAGFGYGGHRHYDGGPRYSAPAPPPPVVYYPAPAPAYYPPPCPPRGYYRSYGYGR